MAEKSESYKANPITSTLSSAENGAIPLWIGTGETTLFAWYHPATGPLNRHQAVVLCNPFGSEAMLLHPAYRQMAMDLAAAGYPCLRFDYPGTNDSAGYPRDEQLLKRWITSIHIAIDQVRQLSGVTQVTLFGVLLGGTLALQAASEREDINGLILWAPYLMGKNFLRAVKLQGSVITANPDGIRRRDWQDGDSEAFGFLISKDFSEDLRKLDLTKISHSPCKRACLFVRDISSNEKKLAVTLSMAGVDVDFREQAPCDLTRVMEKMEHTNVLNQEVIHWLEQGESCKTNKPPEELNALNSRLPQKCLLKSESGANCFEEFVIIDDQAKMFSILSRPEGKTQENSIGILLVNGGANHRVGINRNYTEWARNWATQGYCVLRIDICGLGDSPPRPGEKRNRLYLDSTIKDIQQSCSYLKEHAGVQHLVVIGLCGGAYQSLQYANQCADVSGVILINPQRFQKPPTGDDGSVVRSSVWQLINTIPFSTHLHFLLNIKNWRLLINYRKKSLYLVIAALRQFVIQLQPWCLFGHGHNRAEYNSVAKSFHSLCERKIHLMVLCNSGEVILPFLKVALARFAQRLNKSEYFQVQELDNTNHILSPLWSQERAYELITEQLARIADSVKAEPVQPL